MTVKLDWSQSKNDTVTDQEKLSSKDKQGGSGGYNSISRNHHVSGQQFEFVTHTYPFRNRDPEARRLVRSHVMKVFRRQQSARMTKVGRNLSRPPNPQTSYQLPSNSPRRISNPTYNVVQTVPQSIDSLCGTFPVAIPLHLQKRLMCYLAIVPGATYPFDSLSKYNPVRAGWFQSTIADKGLFHSLLYFACVTTGMIDSDHGPKDTIIQFDKTLCHINRQLSKPTREIPKAVIDALSCVALAQALRGDFESWNLHMVGLQKMVHAKGGVSAIDVDLMIRLLLADIVGAAEFVVKSHFEFKKLGPPSTNWASVAAEMSTADTALVQALESCGLRSSTIAIFKEIHTFSRTISHALNKRTISSDLSALLEDSLLLKHRLLYSPDVDWACSEEWGLDEACRLGALLYIEGIFREFPFSAIGPRNVIRKFREALCKISPTATALAPPLKLWLFFIGGVSTKDKSDRTWFITHLVKVGPALKGQVWNEVKLVLQKLLWIEEIYEGMGRSLWEEIGMNCPT